MQRTVLSLVLAIAALLASAGAAAAQSGPQLEACTASEGGVGFVCGPKDVEDIIPVPGSDWLIGGETGIRQPPGGLVAINTRTKTWRRIFPTFDPAPSGPSAADCKTAPDPKKFTALGLGLAASRQGPMQLYAVERVRHAIEIFDLRLTSMGPEVSWKNCIMMPPGQPGNSVLPLPDGRLAISTFLEANYSFPELFRGVNTGRVLIWLRDRGFTELPGSFSAGANGLALSPRGDSILVAVTGTREVLNIALDGRGVLQRIPLQFGPDNLRIAPDGSILAAGRALEAECGDLAPAGQPMNPNCIRGVIVVKINPSSGAVQQVVRTPPNPKFAGGSGAAQVGDDIWLTAFPSDGVGYVKAK